MPLKSLLRDHDDGKEDKILEPTIQIKSPVDLTVVQAAPATVAPSLHLSIIHWASWETPCAMVLGRGTVGKCPFYFLQARVVWTVVSTGKKAQTLVQTVQMFGFCTSSSDTSQGFS